jgi:hypothetical protein
VVNYAPEASYPMQFQDRLWGELVAHVSGAMNLLRDLFLGLEDMYVLPTS